jgi:NACHT domain
VLSSPDLSEQRSKFLLTLCEFDHLSILQQVPKNRGKNCQWILTCPQFASWKNPNSPRVLWLWGLVGTRKSVLARYIIDHLQGVISAKNQNNTPEQSLSYFFCSDKDSRRKTSTALLRSVLSQILMQNAELFQLVHDHQLKKPDDLISTTGALWDCFRRILEKGRGIEFWIVIDALDELPEAVRRDVLDGFRSIIAADLVGRVKLMVTDHQGPSADYQRPMALDIQTIYLDIDSVSQGFETSLRSEVQSYCAKHRAEKARSTEVNTERARHQLKHVVVGVDFGSTCTGKRSALQRDMLLRAPRCLCYMISSVP